MGHETEDPRITNLSNPLTDRESFAREYLNPRRVRTIREWKKGMARREYSHFLNYRAPVSADGYKESPHRYGGQGMHGRSYRRSSVRRWAENEMRRKGWGEALSQKKASIRKKWGLHEGVYLPPNRPRKVGIEPFYTGMFT